MEQMGMEAWSTEKRQQEMERAEKLAQQADVAVLALGEAVVQGGEGGSRTCLDLPGDQLELLRRVREKAAKVVVVLFGDVRLFWMRLAGYRMPCLKFGFRGPKEGMRLPMFCSEKRILPEGCP